MNKKYFSKFKIKDKVLKQELARAHGMVVLLTIALMGTLAAVTTFSVDFDAVLAFFAVLLLAVVGLISLSVVIAITNNRK